MLFRSIQKYFHYNQISKLEIPTGNPLHIKFDDNENISECRYLDNDRAKDLVVF